MDTEPDSTDRRGSERFPAHLALSLQPVDIHRQPVDEPFEAVSIDLSQSGICCIGDRPLLADFAIIRLQAAVAETDMFLVAQRVRCQRKGALFEIALQFVEKLPSRHTE
jgi:hypothetical protein